MKIKGGFDYYDHLAYEHGIDEQCVLVRQDYDQGRNFLDLHSAIAPVFYDSLLANFGTKVNDRCMFAYKCLPSYDISTNYVINDPDTHTDLVKASRDYTLSSYGSKWHWQTARLNLGIVIIGQKYYTGLTLKTNNIYYHVWDRPTIFKLISETKSFIKFEFEGMPQSLVDLQKNKHFYNPFHIKSSTLNDNIVNVLTDSIFEPKSTPPKILQFMKDCHVTIIASLQNHDGGICFNPSNLGAAKFNNRLTDKEIYQDIMYWINNDLNSNTNQPNITDDIIIRDKKGFDNKSFKHRK